MSWLDRFLSAYNTIQSSGLALPQRSILNFTNATVTDDPINERTDAEFDTTADGTPLATPDTLVLRDGGAAAAFGALVSPELASTADLALEVPNGETVQINDADGTAITILPDSNGVTAIVTAPTVTATLIGQTDPRPGTGAAAGATVALRGQPGQAQTGGAANNDGGPIALEIGDAGTGGGGAAGKRGHVRIGSSSLAASTGLVRMEHPGTQGPLLAKRNAAGDGNRAVLSYTGDAVDYGDSGTGNSRIVSATGTSQKMRIGTTDSIAVTEDDFAVTLDGASFELDAATSELRVTLAGALTRVDLSQVELGDGIGNVKFHESTSTPTIRQETRTAPGAYPGQALFVIAQGGAPQTGGDDNNDGGSVILKPGIAGVGGGGDPGFPGVVQLQAADGSPLLNVADTSITAYADTVISGDLTVIGDLTAPGTWRFVRRTADSAGVVSSTVMVDDGVLQFDVGANEVWEYYASIFVTCATAGGSRETITVPAGAVGDIHWTVASSAAAGGGCYSFATELTHGAGTNCLVTMRGLVITAGTAGTVKVRYAQSVSNAQPTIHKAHSFVSAWRRA